MIGAVSLGKSSLMRIAYNIVDHELTSFQLAKVVSGESASSCEGCQSWRDVTRRAATWKVRCIFEGRLKMALTYHRGVICNGHAAV